MNVLSVSNLRKRFNLEAGFFAPLGRYVYAVNGVSFTIGNNESYGLVGESGCGKTTTARLLVRMYEADEGEILFQGKDGSSEDVRKLKRKDLKAYRDRVKYVFQDPARSLNPRMTIYEVLTSGARWSGHQRSSSHQSSPDQNQPNEGASRKDSLRDEAAAILEEVGLSAADLDRRPAEFSGGQRQRISIARGLIMKPDLLICDEVVSALDVSIQGQILNLLLDIRKRRVNLGQHISFLFIAHDLKVACYFCDRIGVMYQGEIMEEAPAGDLWKNGLHPYTELLFASIRNSTTEDTEEHGVSSGIQTLFSEKASAKNLEANMNGEASNVSGGCAFASRCPYVEERCVAEKPPLREAGPSHLVRCWKFVV